jgi:hypothetical protein
MKRLAAREAVVVVPVVIEPIEVQDPAAAVEVEVRNVEVAVRIALKYTVCHPKHRPSNFLGVE